MAKCSVAQLASILTFTFAHGEVVNVNADELPQEIKDRALMYGLRQKLQDSYSGQKDPADAHKSLQSLLGRLTAGEWTAGRESTGGATSTALSRLITALVNLNPSKTAEEIEPQVAALDESQLKALRARPAVAAELARIRAEELAVKAQAAGKGDLESLFDQI